jgi:alpha/beta superfamily hydrolase
MLSGILHTPRGRKEKALAIVCHGYTGGKHKDFIPELCAKIASEGLYAFRFDFSGSGCSEGSFREQTYSKSFYDLECVIDYFCEQGYEVKSIVGHSMGGTIAIIAAAHDTRIKSAVDIAGFTNAHSVRRKLPGGNGYGEPLAVNSFRLVKKISMPLLFVTGGRDWIQRDMRALFREANEPKEIIVFPRADHCFEGPEDRKRMIEICARWIKNI